MPGSAASASAASRAIPKSVTIARPSAASRMLPGLMSRWTMPRTWATPRARATSSPMRAACRGASRPPRRSRAARSSPIDEGHHEVGLVAVGAGVEAGDDVRVAQDGRGERLAPEPVGEVGVGRDLGTQDLDRDLALEADVGGPVDRGHPAAPDDRPEPVATTDGSGLARIRHGSTIAETGRRGALRLGGIGAGDEVRTRDMQLGRLPLYQLSYSRTVSVDLRRKVRSRWQFAHTISHAATSSSIREVPARPINRVTAARFEPGSRWSKSMAHGGNRSPQSMHGTSRIRSNI